MLEVPANALPIARVAGRHLPAARSGESTSHLALTDFDVELATIVGGHQHARRALLSWGERLERGARLAPGDLPATTFALLVIQGSLIRRTRVSGAPLSMLVTSGDLIAAGRPQSADGPTHLTATETVLIAALDERFIQAAAIWPELMVCVRRRLAEQQHRRTLQAAICRRSRGEERVLALVEHLAQRIGRSTEEGVLLTRPLAPVVLAELAGDRPRSVAAALEQLQQRDRLRRRADGLWLLPHLGADRDD